MRNKYLYIIFILLLFVALITLKHFSPKPIDWKTSYNNNSKSPYSCYVINDMLPTLFPEQSIKSNEAAFFISLDTISTNSENIIVVSSDFNPDQYDINSLLKFVRNGNNVFIASTSFSDLLLDTLNIELITPMLDSLGLNANDEVLHLNNIAFENNSAYHFNKKMPIVYFSAFDSINTNVLGTNKNEEANFIYTKYGLGSIYLNTQPLAFTNYHILYGNYKYAANALSYLPIQKTYFDNFYKPYRIVNTSPMRYILSQTPLQTAYYILVLTLIFYMLFESKRKQRIIPIVTPPKNQSLQFVKTIGKLYLKQHNNVDIAKKKIIYFKDFLRERYYINSISTDSEFIKYLSSKSGIDPKQTKQLINSVQYFETAHSITDDGIIELSHRIDLFYKQCL